MKKSLLIAFLFALIIFSNRAISQTYTTESKSCGSCSKAVSVNSTVGMTCPHCGVRWGHENETRSTSTNYNSYKNTNNYEYNKTSGFTTGVVNLRSEPSTKSSIITKIPAYTTVEIILENGDWYYVKYSHFNGYDFVKIHGYIYKTLLN